MTRIEQIRNFMEKLGIPGRDLYAIPDSDKTFPDGCHYRMEIAGIEHPSALETLLVESKKGRYRSIGSLPRWAVLLICQETN